MAYSIKELVGYTVRGQDGEIGAVQTFYFDDQDWVVRYLVVETGDWLNGRRVLLSPLALDPPDPASQTIPLALTRETVANSPDVPLDRPITRQHEMELYSYYNWPFYWGIDTGAGPGLSGYPLIELASEVEGKLADQQAPNDANLRSSREVLGYTIQARDGEVGQLDDLIADETTWRLQYLVVDTGGWLPGRKVILAPTWIEDMSFPDASLSIDLERETVQNSPEWDPSQPLDQDYEDRLYTHYGRERDRE